MVRTTHTKPCKNRRPEQLESEMKEFIREKRYLIGPSYHNYGMEPGLRGLVEQFWREVIAEIKSSPLAPKSVYRWLEGRFTRDKKKGKVRLGTGGARSERL